jgi:hypothetical protein
VSIGFLNFFEGGDRAAVVYKPWIARAAGEDNLQVYAIFEKSNGFAIFMGHPERSNKAEPRDLDRAKKARARYEHAELFLCEKLLCVCGTATLLLRSHCGAKRLVVCSFASLHLANFGSTPFHSG